MKSILREYIAKLGEYINNNNNKPLENIYYILTSIKWIYK